ncbi:hypothetical protein [Mucilaginibacter sp.]|uniref:hypothetical protein n=1 Tax=Mucilaginibacter sp. TaxID=1882438 RepID=UPI0035BBC12A
MSVQEQIDSYISSQPGSKRSDMKELHQRILRVMPDTKLWFDDGKNSEGKTVSNPSIGYGSHITNYADGSAREYYQIGISANTMGISVYILGIEDKMYLANAYRETIGKAIVTGYCIKFKKLSDLNLVILEDAIQVGVNLTS